MLYRKTDASFSEIHAKNKKYSVGKTYIFLRLNSVVHTGVVSSEIQRNGLTTVVTSCL
jgi:hypothetical protein